jgi:hypothetical protein
VDVGEGAAVATGHEPGGGRTEVAGCKYGFSADGIAGASPLDSESPSSLLPLDESVVPGEDGVVAVGAPLKSGIVVTGPA